MTPKSRNNPNRDQKRSARKTDFPSVLICGSSSYLAGHLLKVIGAKPNVHAVRRPTLTDIASSDVDVIVNFGIRPEFYFDAYKPDLDIDRTMVDIIASLSTHKAPHYFMLSSRMVYGRGTGAPFRETDFVNPNTVYGLNKSRSENYVIKRLGAGATILRLGNIFGLELERRTFTGIALKTLATEGCIKLDINPKTKRDFLPVERFAEILTKLILCQPGDIINIGSGIGSSVGDMAKWFAEGFGRGAVASTSTEVRDSFVLDIKRLKNIVGQVTTHKEIRSRAHLIGRKLRNE